MDPAEVRIPRLLERSENSYEFCYDSFVGNVKMARRRFADDDDEDWRGEDWRGDDESWREGLDDDDSDFGQDDDEDEPTVRCPHCRREIHESAALCPYCRNWISKEDAPPAPKPWWLVLGVAACLYVIYRWIVG